MNEAIFFWLAPSVLAIFTLVFVAVAISQPEHLSARWAAAGFAVALVALLADTAREPDNLILMACATALHWVALGLISTAYVVRKGGRLPRRYVGIVAATGLAVLLHTTFVERDPALGSANANLIGAAIQAGALPVLLRRSRSIIDRILAGTVIFAASCYFLRGVLFLPRDAAEIDAAAGFWSLYNLTFYLTTGALALIGGIILLLGIGSDLIERHSRASGTDHLTGIANLRAFEGWIGTEGTRAGFAAVLLVDLDHFKAINDRFGHETGDRALIAAAGVLDRMVGGEGRVARIGGEEFAVLLYPDGQRRPSQVAEDIRAGLAGLEIAGIPGGLTGSVGVVPIGDASLRQALRAADQAVYAAKREGRNRVMSVDAPSGSLPATDRPLAAE
ncbi:hypothetical protein B5C34_00840 [Pacificimonas flava]|uniref:diguanylate cyclase n=2 Tax=Pacificimonas TaxID=1960290 RepID=A0A219B1Y6_9SPHN|nr:MULTISPECIES: GGDEF domain-containing protein [Pacificimonas]MBZ6378241.1 GGDEF domain-containing protein [Pacificimonas aurantium]OWV32136.1 hypothetical protein B5C34_00840 [Pacificimonas flava]